MQRVTADCCNWGVYSGPWEWQKQTCFSGMGSIHSGLGPVIARGPGGARACQRDCHRVAGKGSIGDGQREAA